MVCYLAALSRKCERPFGCWCSPPPRAVNRLSSKRPPLSCRPRTWSPVVDHVSGALLFGHNGTAPQVLFVAEERGSSRAAYALKLLVSEAVSRSPRPATTPRDCRVRRATNRGPLSLMMTTTSTTLDPELENRLVVLGVDEDAAQTSAIIRASAPQHH